MKTLIMILGAVLFATGCSQKPDPRNAQIAALQVQLELLETRFDATNYLTGKAIADLRRQRSNDLQVALSGLLELQFVFTNQLASVKDSIMAQFARMPTNRPTAMRPAARPVTPKVEMSHGVPSEVYSQIWADAMVLWPNDYRMQSYEVDRQIEAYRKLHP